MTIENVKAFYERLAKDEAFKTQIEKAEDKQQCSQIVREAGYDFTKSEFEEFTAQLLESNPDNIENSEEIDLEAIVGGTNSLLLNRKNNPVPIYGLPPNLY